MLNWTMKSDVEYKLLSLIANRISKASGRPYLDWLMDVELAYQDCPMRLEGLLNAGDSDFYHDLDGIRNHLNRETGKLEDCFVPRFAQ
jgi:hypothetical protein